MQIEISEKNFPYQLSQLEDPPQKLYCSQEFDFNLNPMLAVVGARKMLPWVSEWMENELYPVFKKIQPVVISGGAGGVDQKAHALALRAGCQSVFVLPSGIDRLYPASLETFRGHKRAIFLSEYAPDQDMRKYHFYKRNRIIAGLAFMVIVIQASERSGTMITARMAREQGVTVASVPASPLQRAFAGNNYLLYEGAHLVRNRFDLMSLIESELYSNSSSCVANKLQQETAQ